MRLLLIAFLVLFSSVLGFKSYEGHKVLRVQVPDEKSAEDLLEIQDHYIFWSEIAPGKDVDIMMPPGDALPKVLSKLGLAHEVMIEDVQPLIDAQFAKAKSTQADGWWDSYHPFDEITAKMNEIANNYPIAEAVTIGGSTEGLEMTVVTVCSTGTCGSKPGMYIEGGIHAREWISPAVCTWLLNNLLNDTSNQNYIDELDWYFLANTNPDGYSYTWTDDRMWRKTRSINDGSICIGKDPNRNFPAGFNTVGSSDSPCSDTYHGPAPFSEPELQNVRDYLEAQSNVQFFNDLHSYSQEILLPWGYQTGACPDHDDQMRVAADGAAAIKAIHDHDYIYGDTYDTIYPAGGIALDWAYDNLNIKYSVSVELRDKGRYGFLLPAEQIIDTAEEMWEMHKVFADAVIAENSKA